MLAASSSPVFTAADPTGSPGLGAHGPDPDAYVDHAGADAANADAASVDRAGRTLIIGCGALARELVQLIDHLAGTGRPAPIDLTCLPAGWHNHPDRIPDGVDGKIRSGKAAGYGRILVAYGDCGSGGLLDAVLQRHGVERIGGPHCYAFYAGEAAFDAMMDEDLGSFFLTDYLARHFDTLIVKGMGLDRHPDLRDLYFAHYHRLVYLAQTDDPALQAKARAAADRLSLTYAYRFTGYGDLAGFMDRAPVSWTGRRFHRPGPVASTGRRFHGPGRDLT